MTVARRFIAGSVNYTGLRPGATAECRRSCVKAEGPPLLNAAGNTQSPFLRTLSEMSTLGYVKRPALPSSASGLFSRVPVGGHI